MRIHRLFLFLVLPVAQILAACAAPNPPMQANLGRTALYEEQVEEGFGHLDHMPVSWAQLPR